MEQWTVGRISVDVDISTNLSYRVADIYFFAEGAHLWAVPMMCTAKQKAHVNF